VTKNKKSPIFATYKITMNLKDHLQKSVKEAIKQLFDIDIETADFQSTRKEFEGDITLVVFSLLRYVKGNPV
jgi:arginyl-tRNA synthetase